MTDTPSIAAAINRLATDRYIRRTYGDDLRTVAVALAPPPAREPYPEEVGALELVAATNRLLDLAAVLRDQKPAGQWPGGQTARDIQTLCNAVAGGMVGMLYSGEHQVTQSVEARALDYIYGTGSNYDWARIVDEQLIPPLPLLRHLVARKGELPE